MAFLGAPDELDEDVVEAVAGVDDEAVWELVGVLVSTPLRL